MKRFNFITIDYRKNNVMSNIEIERKFLVKKELLPVLSDPIILIQGYISQNPVVRIRTKTYRQAEEAFLTIKGEGTLIRQEFEFPIEYSRANEMLKLLCKNVISKKRYEIYVQPEKSFPKYPLSTNEVHADKWEIDEFLGRLTGLWLAEIELSSPDQEIYLPKWIGKEVTEDTRYANVNLSSFTSLIDYPWTEEEIIKIPL